MRSEFDRVNSLVLDGVRDGLTLEDASSRAGVSVNTVAGWARTGRKEPAGRFGAFASALDDARETAAGSLPAGPMDLEELREVVAQSARKGSVQAMKLALELVRLDGAEGSRPADPFSELDELAAARRNRRGTPA